MIISIYKRQYIKYCDAGNIGYLLRNTLSNQHSLLIRLIFLILSGVSVIFFPVALIAQNQSNIVPRTVIALYNPNAGPIRDQLIHTAAEMPLNYLGLDVRYYDVNKPLPNIAHDPKVLGILTWFTQGKVIQNPLSYIHWIQNNIKNGKKLVILGNPGFLYNPETKKELPTKYINKVFRLLGLQFYSQWQNSYHDKIIYKNTNMVEFEKTYAKRVRPYYRIKRFNYAYTSYLKVAPYGDNKEASDLIVTGPNGGYAAANYEFFSIYSNKKKRELKQWYINPFLFFKKAFHTENIPKPDVTTLDGLRIFFSHIDGDGWNNVTYVSSFPKHTLSAEVIYEKILKAYPDIPVTVSAIAADIDSSWVGTEKSKKIARKIFALDNVQVATHTYSHPFEWEFFEHYNPNKEKIFFDNYTFGTWLDDSIEEKSFANLLGYEEHPHHHTHGKGYKLHAEDYDTPRAFANKKFDIYNEIIGSINKINEFTPQNKKANIVLWSGNTTPFQKALEITRKNNFYNMNGGDSRFDNEYNSNAWVSGIGKRVGNELQIYAVNSNENTYTDLWTNRFFGFKFLPQTFYNTEVPKRLKPMNLYYHMYSGEKLAALNALLSNIKYIQSQSHISITALDYIKTATGFYSTKFIKISNQCWQVKNRGKLNTIRFDDASIDQVDFSKSTGVIGQNYYRGSMYVSLEPTYQTPEICLKKIPNLADFFNTSKAYLVSSTWQIKDFYTHKNIISFFASGWGNGKFKLVVPKDGLYKIKLEDGRVISSIVNNHFLTFEIKNTAFKEKNIVIKFDH